MMLTASRQKHERNRRDPQRKKVESPHAPSVLRANFVGYYVLPDAKMGRPVRRNAGRPKSVHAKAGPCFARKKGTGRKPGR
jgi:hypothetical protein